MRGPALFVVLFLAVVAQVTVAPLFPVAGAVPDLVLLTLCLAAAFAGPSPVMVMTPVGAVMLGMLSDRGAGLLLLAYVPVVVIRAVLDDAPLPLGEAGKTWLTMLGSGLAARTVLALGAMLAGAPMMVGPLVSQVLLPGVFIDAVLLLLFYVPLRLVGLRGAGFAGTRGRFLASL